MDFFNQYFLEPIETGAGYNIVNTAVYAVILTLSLFVIIEVLKRMGVKLDDRLWMNLLPFIVLGGVLRALEDAGFFPHTWILITPGIYFLVFGLAFGSILADKRLKTDITKTLGLSLLIVFGIIALLNGQNWLALALTLALSIASFGMVFYLLKFLKSKVLKGKNWMVLFAHILDGSASFLAISFLCVGQSKYIEQHVVPSFLFSNIGIWAFIPLKIAIVLLALWVIDREVSKEWRWMFKFAILVLGLGPGIRNLLTAFMNSTFC